MLVVEPRRWFALAPWGSEARLEKLQACGERLQLGGALQPAPASSGASAPELELRSGERRWSVPLRPSDQGLHFAIELEALDLQEELLLSWQHQGQRLPWVALQVWQASEAELQQWQSFFSGASSALPEGDLERISRCAMGQTLVQRGGDRPPAVAAFCDRAASQELVVEATGLRHQGCFPSVLGLEPGRILASRLVLNWNLLLIEEGGQRYLVFQGVSSSDAVLLPGLKLLLLVCHIDAGTVRTALTIVCRDPAWFTPAQPARFGGYLVGHSRPYHCFYDNLLALQAVREAGELSPADPLISKQGEAFVDLGQCLGLEQPHQQLPADALNARCSQQQAYLLQLGFWFHTGAEEPQLRQLAAAVDAPLRQAALEHSQLQAIGALEPLQRCRPLLWIGVTGQKRRWIEQVEGTAALLNALQERYPDLGVVFDGWTPPLHSSDYHRQEARNDDRVIRQIIKRLRFPTKGRLGVVAGLPLLEKVRVGLAVDAFVANYTTGSLNVARICARPGVGHMGRRMAASKHQHIHHRTREPDPALVRDVSDPSTPTGYVDYSLPWQALHAELLTVLAEQLA